LNADLLAPSLQPPVRIPSWCPYLAEFDARIRVCIENQGALSMPITATKYDHLLETLL
jgi:hypothetical protein